MHGSELRTDLPSPEKCLLAVLLAVGTSKMLCLGLLDQRPLSEINDHANRTASFVCSQMGATPVLPKELLEG